MGLLRFYVDPVDAPQDWPEAHRAFISSYDGRVHSTRFEFDGRMLACRRAQRDSGKLHIPWMIEGRGCLVVSTTSLPERDQPYILPLELARGKLAEVREQAAAWLQLRMILPDRFPEVQSEAFQLLARASASQTDLSHTCRLAEECLRKAFEAADLLTRAYIFQRQASRRGAGGHGPTLLGCRFDPELLESPVRHDMAKLFSAAVVPLEWKSIEPQEGQYLWEPLDRVVSFCSDHRLMMRGGPLVDLGSNGLPAWLKTWENDILNLPSFVCDFVETVIGRYTGPIRVWEVAARGNTGGALLLSEEHRLALVARILETAVRTHSDGQFFIRIDQPWGEYQARGEQRLSPIQFVDALLRSNLGLTGVNLEIAMGYGSEASLSRDLLSVSRLIDLWSQLGTQLHVTVACPSAVGPDPRSDSDLKVNDSVLHGGWTESAQAAWLNDFLSLLTAKPSVTGVFLSHLDDSLPHWYPHAGLLNAKHSPKESWDVLKKLGQDAASA